MDGHRGWHCTAAQVCVSVNPFCHNPECAVCCSVLCHSLVPMAFWQNQWPTGYLVCLPSGTCASASSSWTKPVSPRHPPGRKPSQAQPPSCVGLCRTSFHRLSFRRGLLAKADLVLVTRHCSLQVGISEMEFPGLRALSIPA